MSIVDEYGVRFHYVSGRILGISYVEQLASSDETKSDSYMYWVLLQRADMFAINYFYSNFFIRNLNAIKILLKEYKQVSTIRLTHST